MNYAEIDNQYQRNDEGQTFLLTITLMLMLSIFSFSIIQNYNFPILNETRNNNINYINNTTQSDASLVEAQIINDNNIEELEYQTTGITNEVLIKGKLKECLDKLILDGKIQQDNLDQIQNTINNFYEISKLRDLQTEININLDDENDKSIKKILLKIDDSRYLQVINDNNTYKVDKIFQDKLNIQSLDLKPISTENLQNISLKNNNLQNTIPIELKDYKIITKTIKINDNIQFLKNIPIQQLVNFKQTNGKTKTQNLTLTTLLHKTKEKNEILFFSISNGNKSIKYYGQKNKNGSISYFTKNGVSAHTVSNFGFPINSSYKISSTFGMRYHPILFYKRMHTGIDIRAKHGTPIFAPSDGKIEFIGSKSGYGKYIILKHNEKYKSAYGHLSSFGNGLKVGSYVKRGQIIGKVGATGMASGPHLHYEIMEKNKFVNPLKVNFSQNITLDKRSMKTFTPNVKNIDSVMHKIDTINKNNVKIA